MVIVITFIFSAKRYLIAVSTHYVCMSDDSEKIRTSFVFVFSRPSLIDELGRFDCTIVLELEKGQLTSDFDRMILKIEKYILSKSKKHFLKCCNLRVLFLWYHLPRIDCHYWLPYFNINYNYDSNSNSNPRHNFFEDFREPHLKQTN